MGDDAERMAALKRAYADIILNTAKESAARVLASERKVLQLQQSLSLAKEESLAMLLRLKAIMDAKMSESEKANLSQVRKIQQLELQLSEAKGTINYLRSELKRLDSELDHKRDIQAELLDRKSTGHIATSDKYDSQENIHNSDSHRHSPIGPKRVPNSDYCFTKVVTQDEPVKNLIASDNCAGNPDLASIILSNKEPELYRNGCTQRIRAFERNPVTGIELSAQIHNQVSNIKSASITCDNEKAERSGTKGFAVAKRTVRCRRRKVRRHIMISSGCGTYHDQIHESIDTNHSKVSTKINDQLSNIMSETTMCGNGKAERPKDFGMTEKIVRKRYRRCRKKPTRRCSYHDMQHYGLLDTDVSKVGQSGTASADNMHKTGSKVPIKMLNSCSAQVSGEDQETTEGQKTKLNKSFSDRSSAPTSDDRIMTRGTVLKLCNTYSENHIGRIHTSSSGTTCQENSLKEKIIISKSEMIDDALSDEDIRHGTQLEEKMLTTPDHKLAEDLDTSVTKEHLETVNLDLIYEPSRTFGPAAEAGRDKILKYTFQRKRKRGSLDSKVGSTSLEENNMSKQKVEKDDAVLEPQKSNLVVESSRDSRRLAQVARQLISLSERRWW